MAEQPRDEELIGTEQDDETRELEQERVRASNDRDQAMERTGERAPHNRGYDETVRGSDTGDVDPDSAQSDVDRDDTIND